MTVEIKDKLYKDIVGYCEVNSFDVNVFINDLLKKEFTVEKYGERPSIFEKKDEFKPVEDIKPVPLDLDKDSKLYGTKEAIKAVVEAHDKINVPEDADETIKKVRDDEKNEPDINVIAKMEELIQEEMKPVVEKANQEVVNVLKEHGLVEDDKINEPINCEKPKKKRRKLS